MKGALLGIVATIALASPAMAQDFTSGFGGGMGGHRPSFNSGFTGRPAPNDMRHRSGDSFAYPYYGYGDYDANRSFDEEKWNDWWHDRPDRSYPRWVWRNQNCTPDRMWWSGAGWRCTP